MPVTRPGPDPAMRTYSHLARAGRLPTEYEIATTRLHHHVERGFEVNVPAAAFYARHGRGSRWRDADWELFADPRETTYPKYTRLQSLKEAYVDGLLQTIEDSGYDAELSPSARALLDRTIAPLRYVSHALQMVAAYVGQMAPASRITIAATFQAADELRRVHRLAYRMAQLRRVAPTFGAGAREAFERAAPWQPLRRLLERLLVTYDWAESFVALDLCVKPALDAFFHGAVPAAAKARGDHLTGQIFASFEEDGRWHRDWAGALTRVAIEAGGDTGAGNRAACDEWRAAWRPESEAAVAALSALLEGGAA
jgi:toluene monooxygenase system protein E